MGALPVFYIPQATTSELSEANDLGSVLVNQMIDARSGALRLLVTGGSQGARVIADIVPDAIAALPERRARSSSAAEPRRRPRARERTYERRLCGRRSRPSSTICRGASPPRISSSRAPGASTVSELAAMGRASMLVPFAAALDADQAANAGELDRAGARRSSPGGLHAGLARRAACALSLTIPGS